MFWEWRDLPFAIPRVYGTHLWKWPCDSQINVWWVPPRPSARKEEDAALWKKARNSKGCYSFEQKGSGKWFSHCFHLRRCWACAGAKQCSTIGLLPSQLPWRTTSLGIEAGPREANWRPCSLVLCVSITGQTLIQRCSGDGWSLRSHVKHGTGYLQHEWLSILHFWPPLGGAQHWQHSLYIVARILGLEELLKVIYSTHPPPSDAPAPTTTKLSSLPTHDALRDGGLKNPFHILSWNFLPYCSHPSVLAGLLGIAQKKASYSAECQPVRAVRDTQLPLSSLVWVLFHWRPF